MFVVSRFLSSFGFLLAALDVFLSDILESTIFSFAILSIGRLVSDCSSLSTLATISNAIGLSP